MRRGDLSGQIVRLKLTARQFFVSHVNKLPHAALGTHIAKRYGTPVGTGTTHQRYRSDAYIPPCFPLCLHSWPPIGQR